MEETDVIGHLIEVEHQAANLLFDAQTEADKRTTQARSEADEKFKLGYEKIIQDLETKYKENQQAISETHDKTFSEYQMKMNNSLLDVKAFNNLLDKLLFNS